MDAKDELSSALWSATDWQACLKTRFHALSKTPPTPDGASEALWLARALEAIEPDRLFAVHMYVRAYKCSQDDPLPLARARQLSREIGKLEFAAKAARLEYVHSRDPRSLYIEGVTWLDADHFERAVQALRIAKKELPQDDLLTIALATASRQWTDDGTIVSELRARAASADSPELGAVYLLFAARIMRSLGAPGDEYGRMLLEAFAVNPRDSSVFALLERFLHSRGDQDGLIELYRRRIEAMGTTTEIVEEYRRAGTHLVLDGRFAGLGLRLLRHSLECAYEAALESVPGHIAMHVLLRRYFEEAQLLPDYLGLLVEGLDIPLPGLDRLWLGMAGLDIAWNKLRAARTAYAYAAVVAHYVPDHPLIRDFNASGGLTDGLPGAGSVSVGEWTDAGEPSSAEISVDIALPPPKVPAAESMPDIELSEMFEAVAESMDEATRSNSVNVSFDDDEDFDLEELALEELEELEDADLEEVEPVPGEAMEALKDFRSKPPPLPESPPRPNSVERATRVALPADVQLLMGEIRVRCVTRDVSATGMFLVTNTRLYVGDDVSISVRLPGEDEFSTLEYRITGRVVRQSDNGVGIEYVEPPAGFVARLTELSG